MIHSGSSRNVIQNKTIGVKTDRKMLQLTILHFETLFQQLEITFILVHLLTAVSDGKGTQAQNNISRDQTSSFLTVTLCSSTT